MIGKLKTNTVSLFNILMAMCILFFLFSCRAVKKGNIKKGIGGW
jgi:hypothetical protein